MSIKINDNSTIETNLFEQKIMQTVFKTKVYGLKYKRIKNDQYGY